MFINKFNKLIRNKWIWGIFAVVVCFLFVASDLFRGNGGAARENGYGTLDGEPVSYEAYQTAYQAVRIEDLLQNRGARQGDEPWLANRAWRYAAAARTAAKMGLRVSDSELNQALKGLFSNETGFQPDFYNRFVMEQFRSTTAQFESALAQFLLVGKVSSAFSLASWISEPLSKAQSYGLTDVYTLRTATLADSFANAEVELTDEKLQDFFKRNQAVYRVPEKVSARYVAFKVADFLDKAEAASEEDLQFRYDSDPSRYTGEVDGVKTNLSFEAAHDQLVAESKAENAKDLAVAAAEDFTDSFYNDSRDEAAEQDIIAVGYFEAKAQEAGLTVATTALFAAGAIVPGIESAARAAFSEAAFELSPETSYECYSDALVGKDFVYVLAYGEKVAAHDPEFESVKAEVVAAATKEERARLFGEKLDTVYKSYEAEIQKGRGFEEVAQELGLTVSTNMVMTPMELQDIPGDRRDWMTVLPAVGENEDTHFIAHKDGATFVHVLERKHGDESMRSNYQGFLTSQIGSSLSSRLSDSWLEANFKGMNPVVPTVEDFEE